MLPLFARLDLNSGSFNVNLTTVLWSINPQPETTYSCRTVLLHPQPNNTLRLATSFLTHEIIKKNNRICVHEGISEHTLEHITAAPLPQLAIQVGQHTYATWFTLWMFSVAYHGVKLEGFYLRTLTLYKRKAGQESCDGADVGQERGRTGEDGSRDGNRRTQPDQHRRLWHERDRLVRVYSFVRVALPCLLCKRNKVSCLLFLLRLRCVWTWTWWMHG